MNTLYVMQGLPGSGKTTESKNIMVEGNRRKRMVRLNRDLLREMLHFGVYSSEREKVVKEFEENLARTSLLQGMDVIIDDTNLKIDDLCKWQGLAKECGDQMCIIRLNTPTHICIERDANREERHVGAERIAEMNKILAECDEVRKSLPSFNDVFEIR